MVNSGYYCSAIVKLRAHKLVRLAAAGALPPLSASRQVDFVTGKGLFICLKDMPTVSLVINTVAISSPKVCEEQLDLAR